MLEDVPNNEVNKVMRKKKVPWQMYKEEGSGRCCDVVVLQSIKLMILLWRKLIATGNRIIDMTSLSSVIYPECLATDTLVLEDLSSKKKGLASYLCLKCRSRWEWNEIF